MSYKMTFFVKMPPSVAATAAAAQTQPHTVVTVANAVTQARAQSRNSKSKVLKLFLSLAGCVRTAYVAAVSLPHIAHIELYSNLARVRARNTSNAAAGRAGPAPPSSGAPICSTKCVRTHTHCAVISFVDVRDERRQFAFVKLRTRSSVASCSARRYSHAETVHFQCKNCHRLQQSQADCQLLTGFAVDLVNWIFINYICSYFAKL